MADEEETAMSGDEKAYFESRGEKLPEKPLGGQEKTDDKEETKAPAEAETDELLGDEEAPKEDKKVPLRALTKEREEGKKARQELQELRTKHAVLEDRWNTILQLNQQPEKAAVDEDPEPDPNTDIFAHNAWLKRQVEKVNKTVAERDQADKAAKEETQRETAVWNFWGEAAKAKAAETPDFGDAVKFMSGVRTSQLESMADVHPQFQHQAGIDQQINAELKQLVILAAQQGKSPADVVYNMAKKWGYTGPKPADDPKPDTAGLDKLTKDMEAETSLSGAGGSRPGAATTATDIANMTSDEFEAWYAKNGEKGFKRLQTRGTA